MSNTIKPAFLKLGALKTEEATISYKDVQDTKEETISTMSPITLLHDGCLFKDIDLLAEHYESIEEICLAVKRLAAQVDEVADIWTKAEEGYDYTKVPYTNINKLAPIPLILPEKNANQEQNQEDLDNINKDIDEINDDIDSLTHNQSPNGNSNSTYREDNTTTDNKQDQDKNQEDDSNKEDDKNKDDNSNKDDNKKDHDDSKKDENKNESDKNKKDENKNESDKNKKDENKNQNSNNNNNNNNYVGNQNSNQTPTAESNQTAQDTNKDKTENDSDKSSDEIDMEDIIKAGEYTKIPTATDVNNGNSSSGGSVLLPIGLAVGVAGTTGLAASKIIQKKKEEEEITLDDEEFEEETETYEDDDYGTVVDEEPVEKYRAGNVNQDGTVIKNGYEIGTDIPLEDTLDFD